jgi:zinc transporter ZupT
MRWLYLILILLFTLAGGMIPVWYHRMRRGVMAYLLAFTGAFLLGIVLLHLAPECFEGLGKKAGLYILLGFYLQVFLQRWSHGMEHGHGSSPVHTHDDHGTGVSAGAALGLVLGLSLHAFMAGLPLGFSYSDPSVLPSLALGILLHKMPEAITLMTMLLVIREGKKGNIGLLVLFSLVTPGAALLAYLLNQDFVFIDSLLLYVLAVVTGAFLHISTTIFFESGTRHHELNRGKVASMVAGLVLAAMTLLIS